MSHNIYINGYGDFPWQTPTHITRYILEVSKGNDLLALALLKKWVHDTMDPPKLIGKDSRNQFLIDRRNLEIKELDDRLNEIEEFIKNSKKTYLICST